MENKEFACENGVPDVIGFDWNVKVVLGSSSLANLQQPLIGVDFHLSKSPLTSVQPETKFENLHLELNQTELKNLISVLEKAVANN